MGFFDIFRKTPAQEINWLEVAGKISSTLIAALNTDPKILSGQYARIVLKKDGNVFVASDKRDPKYILGWGDLTFIFLREYESDLMRWIESLKNSESPTEQLIATEDYAKKLTKILMERES